MGQTFKYTFFFFFKGEKAAAKVDFELKCAVWRRLGFFSTWMGLFFYWTDVCVFTCLRAWQNISGETCQHAPELLGHFGNACSWCTFEGFAGFICSEMRRFVSPEHQLYLMFYQPSWSAPRKVHAITAVRKGFRKA